MKPELILINPWIHDFAAYDLWSKPLGLLHLAGYLRKCGFKIRMIDCLDLHHPEMRGTPSIPSPVRRSYGTGKFWREQVPKPLVLKHVNRPYSRYGISRQLFIEELKRARDPAAILITSLMTYWYPGVKEAIALAKRIHPHVPLILGGIYARLCRQHALQFSGADCVVSKVDLVEPGSVLKVLQQFNINAPQSFQAGVEPPYPAFDLLRKIDYVCILTSRGCPYRCHYCASHFLNPEFWRRDPDHVLKEILYWQGVYGIRDFAFYDDALLVKSDTHMVPILENLIKRDVNLRFHTPNALHVREISSHVAKLLYQSGFRTIRLGLETSDVNQHNEMDKKVSEGEFERAVGNLKRAGFTKREIGAYILMGLPGQTVNSVIHTIKFVDKTGAIPYLAEYSPLPHTQMWKKALSHAAYDLSSEPLFHNNTLLPCWDESQRRKVPELKRMVREIRGRDY